MLAACAAPTMPADQDPAFVESWTSKDPRTGRIATTDLFLRPDPSATTDKLVLREILRRTVEGSMRVQWAAPPCPGADRLVHRLFLHLNDVADMKESGASEEDVEALRVRFRQHIDDELAPCWSSRAPD